jgi:hypothetical protein
MEWRGGRSVTINQRFSNLERVGEVVRRAKIQRGVMGPRFLYIFSNESSCGKVRWRNQSRNLCFCFVS